MTPLHTPPESDGENEIFPVEPRYHPIHKITRKIYYFLASAKLAMVLLVTILACCLLGVTIWRGTEAGRLIFGALWFNGILVLLVINIACCFFGRIWGRRVTIISFGMILFHISFVVVLLAIVCNSLFYFRGIIRLTEGESIPSGDEQSYDAIEKGRFFSFSRLQGNTSLIKMHTGYKVSGDDKRAAYEVIVGDEGTKKQGIIYTTHKLTYRGVDYFNDREGYSLLLSLTDKQGKYLYGVHVPLQSIVASKESYQYATGYRDYEKLVVKKGVIPFPGPPESPLFALMVEYLPAKLKEKSGDVRLLVHPLDDKGMPDYTRRIGDGTVALGTPLVAGEYMLSATDVRYWVGMLVRYEPGKPVVLASLCMGLTGMIITTLGRMFKKGTVRGGA